MSIGDAKKFIQTAVTDTHLRNSMNAAKSLNKIDVVLKDYGFAFTYPEFDEAYRNLLVQCQSEEQAMHLNEIKLWWDFCLSVVTH